MSAKKARGSSGVVCPGTSNHFYNSFSLSISLSPLLRCSSRQRRLIKLFFPSKSCPLFFGSLARRRGGGGGVKEEGETEEQNFSSRGKNYIAPPICSTKRDPVALLRKFTLQTIVTTLLLYKEHNYYYYLIHAWGTWETRLHYVKLFRMRGIHKKIPLRVP